MYFKAHIKVTIRGITMPNIVSVKTSNDGQKIGQLCDVVLPLNCYIQYNDKNNQQVYLNAELTNFFKSGDPVHVEAWYEGMDVIDVFDGFIYDFVEGMPLVIKCMDYFYFFNLGIFGNDRVFAKKSKNAKITSKGQGVHYTSVVFKSLLQSLVAFVNRTITNYNQTNNASVLPVTLSTDINLTLTNLTFMNMSPAEILNWFKKTVGFNINVNNRQLYVALASSTLSNAVFNTGRNVIKSNLQKGAATFQRIRVKCWFIREDGTRDSFDIGDESGDMKEIFFYKIKRDGDIYERLAQNALLKYGQHKFSGEIETFLYPEADLFWTCDYTDLRYPDKSGRYTITKTEIHLSERGFRRRHKLSFLVDVNQN
jgi:hypothetical protein